MSGTKTSIRNRVRRRKKGAMALEMNSLLDILVILLVFLIKSYNTNTTIINIPKDIFVPISQSKSKSENHITIQMSPEKKIWVDDKLVVNLNETAFDLYDKGGDRIIALYNELISKKDTITLLAKQSEEANKFSGLINLIMDKSLSYDYIRKIMYTATEAGFKEFKFVVISNED